MSIKVSLSLLYSIYCFFIVCSPYYPIYYEPKNNIFSITKKEDFVEILPIDSAGKKRVWRQTKPSLQKAIDEGAMICKQRGNR